jgi:MEMO1 family protein
MIRLQFAGIFYEKDYVKLMEELNLLYSHELGPGDLPVKRKNESMHAIIVPHDSYDKSGMCSAWAYKLLGEKRMPKRYIILLPDSSGSVLNYGTVNQDIESVFGVCKIDKNFVHDLLNTGIVSLQEKFSSKELEMQIPLLQHISKDKLNEIKIVPIIVPHINNVDNLVEEILNISNDFVLIIVSNFTKYGPKYLYTPFRYNLEESKNELDKSIANYILNLDVNSLRKYVIKNKIQVSGLNSLIVGLEIMKKLKVRKGDLLCYYRSNKTSEDQDNYVSYFSFGF